MGDVPYTLQYEALLFARNSGSIARMSVGSGIPLDRSAFVLLTRLEQDGPRTIRELRDALGLDDSTLNRQTAAIVRDGFAERIRDPEGGIARKFQLTERGRQRLESDRADGARALSGVLAEWPDADVHTLVSWLRRFNEAFERFDDRPWARQPR